MGNHLHLLFIAKDAELCAQFYYELMKKITDYLKRLLGLRQLELWEPGGPVLSQVLDLEAALDRIVYLYANPSRAHLVDSISEYPGYSSWSAFQTSPVSHSEQVPWIRQPTIPALRTRVLGERSDRQIVNKLREANPVQHELTIIPNSLYAAFDIEDQDEIARLNCRVFEEISQRERSYADERARMGVRVVGATRLRAMQIMKEHTPQRSDSDRKILFHTKSNELALSFLEQFRLFCDQCRVAYEHWRSGVYLAVWPPGAFRPPLRPVANALA